MYDEALKLALSLCNIPGTPGCEEDVMKAAARALGFCREVEVDAICGVHGFIGDKGAEKQILLDAHIDQIGMVITEIDEDGFLHITNVGGIDRRTLPGSRVTVYGNKPLTGVVCVLPPHINENKDKIEKVENQAVDIGMSGDEAKKHVAVGDRVILTNPATSLLETRIGGTALDDRAGCAAVIRAGQLLLGKKINAGVHIVLSTKEEVGGQGALIYSNRIKPCEAIAVDVSFAKQEGVDRAGLGELSKGPMIGFSAVLDKSMSQRLVKLAKEHNIPFQLEAMGGRTGTNCDGIVTAGIPCALLSIPQRNMHTPSEVCDLEDIENTARLMACYVESL